MSRERIFVVEDERIIAIDLQRRLERLGYVVCGSAANGLDALDGIRNNRPDLVLMDIVLPGDMDGIDIAAKLREENGPPVIFLSAYTDAETLSRAKQTNPLGYILKPFKERELATVLEMALFKSVADTRVREKEKMFSAILNSTTDAIIVTGADSRIHFLNPVAEQILEINDNEAKNQFLKDILILCDMETGAPFRMPNFTTDMKVLKIPNIRITNLNKKSYVVEMSVTREMTDIHKEPQFFVAFKDISQIHEIADTLRYQTTHDILTGLLNRNELAVRLNESLAEAIQQPGTISVLYIDIDHFKVINDACGTEAGDEMLQLCAGILKNHLTGRDYAARIGGDDFVFVHHDAGQSAHVMDARTLAKVLTVEAEAHPFTWQGKAFTVSFSIGVVPLDPLFRNEHDIMIAGNETVRRTHESGGNRYSIFRRDEAASGESMSISELISRIQESLSKDGFRLYYQPIQPLGNSGDPAKMEVLLRMLNEDGSIVPPNSFIPVAERYNIMPAIDRWVIRNSIRIYGEFIKTGNPLSLNVMCINLSGSSLLDESVIGFIIDTIALHGVPANRICLEVTETNAILNLGSASRFIRILKERGFSFALDDFGSGFSSFGYLKNLPVDYLKIDGSFIRNMDKDKVDYTMVQAISSMCQVLGLKTIGEFAENDDIIGKLTEIGVNYAQGYGISKPLPMEG